MWNKTIKAVTASPNTVTYFPMQTIKSRCILQETSQDEDRLNVGSLVPRMSY